jgi:hypothetical protein
MFSFGSRKAQQDLQQFLLRVINRNGSDRAKVCENQRLESRSSLNLGIWIVPLVGGSPDADAAITAVTRDFSSGGVAVMTTGLLSTEEVLHCLPSDATPRLVRAKVCSRKDLGCGWTLYNLKAVELLDENRYPELLQLDETLVG